MMGIKRIVYGSLSFVFTLFLMSSSCEENSEKIAEMNGGIKATVTTDYVDEGCKILLKATVDGEEKLFLPIELAKEYRVDGKVVLMKYTISRIQQTDCFIAQPIVIDEIVAVN